MLKALKRNASRGNLPSLEFLLKMIGEHPDQLGDGVDHSIHITIDGADDYAD
jgi:type IV secretory pathway protease TraF